jgi:hypothetical protein
MLALELHTPVAQHRARKETCFEQHLETIADAEDGPA